MGTTKISSKKGDSHSSNRMTASKYELCKHGPTRNNGGICVFYAITSRNNVGICVFYAVILPTIETVFSMWIMHVREVNSEGNSFVADQKTGNS
jgi:hypothetical protein